MEYLAELRATIRRLHRCEASHSRTEAVREVVNGQLMWEGNVEVFALLGHDQGTPAGDAPLHAQRLGRRLWL